MATSSTKSWTRPETNRVHATDTAPRAISRSRTARTERVGTGSLTDAAHEHEKAWIAGVFHSELARTTLPAVRELLIASLARISVDLANRVVQGFDVEVRSWWNEAQAAAGVAGFESAPFYSGRIAAATPASRTRRVALLVSHGSNLDSIESIRAALIDASAVPLLVGPRPGTYRAAGRGHFEAETSVQRTDGVEFDALVVVDGDAAIDGLEKVDDTLTLLNDQYRHGKAIMVVGAAARLLRSAGIPSTLPDGGVDPGLIVVSTSSVSIGIEAFLRAVGLRRCSDLVPGVLVS